MTIKPRAARALSDARPRLRDAAAAAHPTAAAESDRSARPPSAERAAGIATALTPLEQAIHDLIGRCFDLEEEP